MYGWENAFRFNTFRRIGNDHTKSSRTVILVFIQVAAKHLAIRFINKIQALVNSFNLMLGVQHTIRPDIFIDYQPTRRNENLMDSLQKTLHIFEMM